VKSAPAYYSSKLILTVKSRVAESIGRVKKFMQSHFEKWFFRERKILLILFHF
jgi:hypothetical protein